MKKYQLKVRVSCSWADDTITSREIEAEDFSHAYVEAQEICDFDFNPDYKVEIILLAEADVLKENI